jgi:hypothetical protein
MTTGLWPYAPEASTATFTPSALSKLSASHVRHPSFNGLRADKPTATIVRETALAAGAATRPASTIKVTNPHLTAPYHAGFGLRFCTLRLVRPLSTAQISSPGDSDRPIGDIRGNRIPAAKLTVMGVRRLNHFPGQHKNQYRARKERTD